MTEDTDVAKEWEAENERFAVRRRAALRAGLLALLVALLATAGALYGLSIYLQTLRTGEYNFLNKMLVGLFPYVAVVVVILVPFLVASVAYRRKRDRQ